MTGVQTCALPISRARGCAIELNTAGLRKDCREIYPSPRILEMAHRLGVPITFGSDAHAAAEVGFELGRAVDLAKNTGYTHAVRFHRREPKMVKIG